jgi:hypothetical protein
MAHKEMVEQLLREEPDLDIHLRKQRELVAQLVRRHQWRHKWVVRTLSTFFWTMAAAAFLMMNLTHNPALMVTGTAWLLLGAIVLVQSRLRHLELKLEGVLALLGTRDKTMPVEESGQGAENTARPL